MSRSYSIKTSSAEKNNESNSKSSSGNVTRSAVPVLLKSEDSVVKITDRPVPENAVEDASTQTTAKATPLIAQQKNTENGQVQPRPFTPVQQLKTNTTGMPDQLKAGIENLSGYAMDDVKVNYNSPKPAQLQALAYAQGNDIHLSAGQEQHLPHEAWHVVQQKQGRVQPTIQLKDGLAANADQALKSEADTGPINHNPVNELPIQQKTNDNTVQRRVRVGRATYSVTQGNEREFRKYLMLNLNSAKYRDLGNRKMWEEVQNWLDGTENARFADWDDLLARLWNDGFLDKKTSYKSSMGPKSLGVRPGFTQATKDEVEISSGQHRRHIISSSTLGLSIEKSYELLNDQKNGNDLQILNDWLVRNGGSKKRTIMDALRTIWSTVHNHVGNLWPGHGGDNTAIGFIRGPLTDLVKKLGSPVKTKELTEQVRNLFMEKGWYKDHWNNVLGVLDHVLSNVEPTISPISLAGAMINWTGELKAIMTDYAAENLSDKTYKALDNLTPIRLEDAIERVNGFKFLAGKEAARLVFIKWLNKFALGKDEITEKQAAEIIDDFIANADLDYPYGLIEHDDKEEYGITLINLYKNIINPSKDHFNDGGVLDAFMRLNYKA